MVIFIQYFYDYFIRIKKNGLSFLGLFFLLLHPLNLCLGQDLPLFYWRDPKLVNFGDYLSLKLVERIVKKPIRVYEGDLGKERKLLAIGSILSFATDWDIVWGAGINGKLLQKKDYLFHHLNVRAVRGPLTREFLLRHFNIRSPEIYGDPGLLFPYFFPEFKRSASPHYPYIVIPHYSEIHLFPKEGNPHVVYPSDPWDEVIRKILDSQFVISSSLHGIVIAEAYGIPARLLRITDHEPLFKYKDYYLGTHRPYFQYAHSVDEALKMGGEPPFDCDLNKLYQAFPFEFWSPNRSKTFYFSKAVE